MSIPFSQGKLQADERKTILQVVQKHMKAAALEAIRPVLRDFLEAEVTVKLGRAKGAPRQVSSTERSIDWQGAHCGCRDAISLPAMGITAGMWKQVGVIWKTCRCRCWNANRVNMM
jgi:hypothetical protein